ncbi:cytochrome c [Alsobacter soli]|uniref:Cytochrome c n=1 Tax=Alsobacter soli TaxID=2109933 RepID=A0A2T1HS27_9HYPH|nr:cytochrome c [Alsobacter soli]
MAVACLGQAALAQSIEEKAQVCAGCHGEAGKPTDKAYPTIWGQNQGYLYLQLRDFKLGNRKNEIMNGIAKDLPREDMMALAEYFSQKKWVNLDQPRASEADVKRSETAITSGQCGACHGADGIGAGTTPRITGQSHDYLLKTMEDFRSKARANNPWMSDILGTLQPEDLQALANFYAGR